MTPRTDDQIGYDGSTNSLVRIDFARQLETELNTLQQWKDEQLAVEATWDVQAVGNELGLLLGSPIRPQILPAIIALRQMVRELRDALGECREDSVELLGEWAWKRGTIPRNDRAIEELEGRISVADSLLNNK